MWLPEGRDALSSTSVRERPTTNRLFSPAERGPTKKPAVSSGFPRADDGTRIHDSAWQACLSRTPVETGSWVGVRGFGAARGCRPRTGHYSLRSRRSRSALAEAWTPSIGSVRLGNNPQPDAPRRSRAVLAPHDVPSAAPGLPVAETIDSEAPAGWAASNAEWWPGSGSSGASEGPAWSGAFV